MEVGDREFNGLEPAPDPAFAMRIPAEPNSMRPSDSGLKPTHLLLLLAYTSAIFLFNLGDARSLTHHELYVAEGAREMLHLHARLVPRVLHGSCLGKPHYAPRTI